MPNLSFFIEIASYEQVVQCTCLTENKSETKEYSRKLRMITVQYQ